MADWYYAVKNEQRGPVAFDTLQLLASKGKLQRTDMVWQEGMAEWKKASQVSGLFAQAAQAEIQSASSVRRRPEPVGKESVVKDRGDDDRSDDDRDDRPRKRKKRKQESSPGAMVAIIGGSVAGGLLLLIIVIVLLVRLGQRRDPAPPQGDPMQGVVMAGGAAPGGDGNPAPGGAAAWRTVTYTVTLLQGREDVRTFQFQKGQRVEIVVKTPQGLFRNPDVDLYVTRSGDPAFDLEDIAISKDCYLQFVAPETDQYQVMVDNLGPGSVTSTVTIR